MITDEQRGEIYRESPLAAVAAILGLWVIPLVSRLWLPSDDGTVHWFGIGFLGLLAGLFLCREFRKSKWIVLVWTPLLTWIALGIWTILNAIVSTGLGGADAGPLGGVAAALGLAAAAVLGVVAVMTLIWRPQRFVAPLVVLAVANTAFVSWATQAANQHATKQEIVLKVLDSSGKPLSRASVQFTRYRYGPGGEHVYDGRGGPISSGEEGIVEISSRLMRYETQGTITKAGYRRVFFILGMQYDKWDKTRTLRISTDETRDIARMEVPATDPVAFSIYLPPQSDTPTVKHPVKGKELEADIGRGMGAKHFLDLATGKFSAEEGGDLRFEVFFKMGNEQREFAQLRITGVNAAKVFQAPPSFSLQEGRPSYENVFHIAPTAGYHNDTVIEDPGGEPGPMIYVVARGGTFYARFTVKVIASSKENRATCWVNLFTNSTDNRLLE